MMQEGGRSRPLSVKHARFGPSHSILAWAGRHDYPRDFTCRAVAERPTARCTDGSIQAKADWSVKRCSANSVERMASSSPRWRKGSTSATVSSGGHFICDDGGAHAARTMSRHAPSERWCGDKMRRMSGSLENPKPTVEARELVPRRGLIDVSVPVTSALDARQGTEQWFRFENVRLQDTELRQAEIPPRHQRTIGLWTRISESCADACRWHPKWQSQVLARVRW